MGPTQLPTHDRTFIPQSRTSRGQNLKLTDASNNGWKQDTHGWHSGHLQEPQYSADWGDYYSFTARMRELADVQGVDLLVVDTGDRIEGAV